MPGAVPDRLIQMVTGVIIATLVYVAMMILVYIIAT